MHAALRCQWPVGRAFAVVGGRMLGFLVEIGGRKSWGSGCGMLIGWRGVGLRLIPFDSLTGRPRVLLLLYGHGEGLAVGRDLYIALLAGDQCVQASIEDYGSLRR